MKAARAIKLGIVCPTEENLNAPWILFEAGALSKAVDDDGRVCTLLSPGLEPGSVEPPLSIFQATRAEKEDLRRMLSDLNAALGGPLKEPDLDGTFEAMWPKLDEAIRLEPETRPAPAKRSPDELLTEILELVRGLSRRPEGPSLSAALSGWTPSESSISPETWKTLAEIYPGIAPMGTLPLNALLLRNLGVHAHLARIPRTEPAPEPP